MCMTHLRIHKDMRMFAKDGLLLACCGQSLYNFRIMRHSNGYTIKQ